MSRTIAVALVGVLMAIWSITLWIFHGVAQWIAHHMGAQMAGSSVPLADWTARFAALQLPPWLAPWWPSADLSAWVAPLAVFTPMLEWLLTQAPALAGWLTPLAWIVWVFGTLLLLLIGIAAIVFLRSRDGRRVTRPAVTVFHPST